MIAKWTQISKDNTITYKTIHGLPEQYTTILSQCCDVKVFFIKFQAKLIIFCMLHKTIILFLNIELAYPIKNEVTVNCCIGIENIKVYNGFHFEYENSDRFPV